jgi:hypothetical protein
VGLRDGAVGRDVIRHLIDHRVGIELRDRPTHLDAVHADHRIHVEVATTFDLPYEIGERIAVLRVVEYHAIGTGRSERLREDLTYSPTWRNGVHVRRGQGYIHLGGDRPQVRQLRGQDEFRVRFGLDPLEKPGEGKRVLAVGLGVDLEVDPEVGVR